MVPRAPVSRWLSCARASCACFPCPHTASGAGPVASVRSGGAAGEFAVPTRPPRPESVLPVRTLAGLEDHPHQRWFVRAVWEQLAELERVGYHTGAIDALRSVLLDHQPATRAGRCCGCRRYTWRHRPILWRYHRFPLPWCPRRFPCQVWSQIGIELLEQGAERGRHRLASAPLDPSGRPPGER